MPRRRSTGVLKGLWPVMDDDGTWNQLPADPWNRIVENLWMGGLYFGPQMQPAIPEGFDVVISMAGRGPGFMRITNPDVIEYSYYIDDGKLGPDELDFVKEAALHAAEAVHEGRKTLVRCQAGLNRSGLVVAFALKELGIVNPELAITHIRAQRHRDALFNKHFQRYIREYFRE